jgi:hypothetical protein
MSDPYPMTELDDDQNCATDQLATYSFLCMGVVLKVKGHDVGNCVAKVCDDKAMRDDLQGAACGDCLAEV